MSVKAPSKKPSRKSAKRSSKSKSGRLAPGELDKLVLRYMRRHKKGAPHTPSAIAKGIKRSSGAVANCLDRLAVAKKVRPAGEKPRRFELSGETD
jgi:hypothetical protein